MSSIATKPTASLALAPDDKTYIGFWIYLMTDCLLFATLFATYAVLQGNTAGGASAAELFSLPFVLAETLLLLASSLTCGLAIVAMHQGMVRRMIIWLVATFVLGAGFLGMELYEFTHLVAEGDSWSRSGFLSAFFTLVGTHGLHITVGLLWLIVMIVRVMQGGLGPVNAKRLTLFSLFWHFLDVVWIFIFTVVYLMGAI